MTVESSTSQPTDTTYVSRAKRLHFCTCGTRPVPTNQRGTYVGKSDNPTHANISTKFPSTLNFKGLCGPSYCISGIHSVIQLILLPQKFIRTVGVRPKSGHRSCVQMDYNICGGSLMS